MRKHPKIVRPYAQDTATSEWLEFLKRLKPELQKKEHFKRKLREKGK